MIWSLLEKRIWFYFCTPENWGQGLVHAKQVLSHWTTLPAHICFNISKYGYILEVLPTTPIGGWNLASDSMEKWELNYQDQKKVGEDLQVFLWTKLSLRPRQSQNKQTTRNSFWKWPKYLDTHFSKKYTNSQYAHGNLPNILAVRKMQITFRPSGWI